MMRPTVWALLLLVLAEAEWSEGTCHSSANDCATHYTAWSPCDPCTHVQSRHLNITAMPHYDGFPCPSSLVQHRVCTTSDVCPSTLAPHPCPGQFDCGHGHCIDSALVCNGDNDCSNNRDEQRDHCRNSTFYSRAEVECLDMKPFPYRDWLSAGFHVARDTLLGRVVDNQKFQGLCRQAYDENKQKVYRLPYNIDTAHFKVKSSDDLQAHTFHSLKEYVDTVQKEHTTSWSHSWSAHAGFLGIFGGSASHSASFTHTDTFKSIYKKMQKKQMTLFRIRASLTVAEFVMKKSELLLDEYFHDAIVKLPNNLNAKSYFDFFDTYGSAWLRSGELGGSYEHYYLFDSSALEQTHMTVTSLKECLKESTGASLKGFVWKIKFGGSASSSSSNCKFANHSTANVFQTSNTATEKIINIVGGTTKAAGRLTGAALAANGSVQATKYEEWVQGVDQNPVLLRKTLSPICDLILSSRVKKAQEKYEACIKATKAYVQPFMQTHCRPCKNGGEVIVVGKQCQCACAFGYHGPTCAENFVGTANGHAKVDDGGDGNPDTKHDIKLLTSGQPPVASNPPYMRIRRLRERDDSVMKSRADRIFVLSSDGPYTNLGANRTGSYDIEEFDEFLNSIATIAVNFSSIDECYNAVGACFIKDFDIDHHRKFWLTIVVLQLVSSEQNDGTRVNTLSELESTSESQYYTVIHHMDRTGNVLTDHKIVKPCQPTDRGRRHVSFLSATCDERLIVTCPDFATATFKIYNLHGEALDLIQFPDYENVTSVQYFGGNLWFHSSTSHSREVGVYSMDTWQQVYRYSPPFHADNDIYPFTQIFVDFANNLIVGQEEQDGFGRDNDKFTIVELTANANSKQQGDKFEQTTEAPPAFGNILVIGRLPGWDECAFAAAYRGKLYLQCHPAVENAVKEVKRKERAILVFDYLK